MAAVAVSQEHHILKAIPIFPSQESITVLRAGLERQLSEAKSQLIHMRRQQQARELDMANEVARMRSSMAAASPAKKDFKTVAQVGSRRATPLFEKVHYSERDSMKAYVQYLTAHSPETLPDSCTEKLS